MSSTIDVRPFLALCGALANISGDDTGKLVDDQSGQLMRVCIQNTYAAPKGKLRTRALFRNRCASESAGKSEGDKLYVTKSGKPWLSDRNDQGKRVHHLMTNSRPSLQRVWAKYVMLEQIRRAKQIDPESAERSRGSAKRAWYQAAREIGAIAEQRCKAPAWVKKSGTFHGKPAPQVAEIKRHGADGDYKLTIIIRSKVLTQGLKVFGRTKKGKINSGLDGNRILQLSIATRANAFRREMERGVFQDLKTRAQRYPGVKFHDRT